MTKQSTSSFLGTGGQSTEHSPGYPKFDSTKALDGLKADNSFADVWKEDTGSGEEAKRDEVFKKFMNSGPSRKMTIKRKEDSSNDVPGPGSTTPLYETSEPHIPPSPVEEGLG